MKPTARYDRVAIALHWAIAATLIAQIAFGFYVDGVPRGTPARGVLINLHNCNALNGLHEVLGKALAVLLCVHVAAALWHWQRRDGVFERMGAVRRSDAAPRTRGGANEGLA